MTSRIVLVALAASLSASLPCSAVPLRGLASIDLTADGRYAVIAGRKDNSVAIVDLLQEPYSFINLSQADGVGVRPIRVRCFGNTAVLVNEHDTKLTLIDVPTATVTGQVSVLMYSQDVVWDAVRSRYYVSNHWTDRVYAYDAGWTPAAPAAGIPVGRMPGPMTLGPDGRLYVGNRGTWDVSVVDPDGPGEVGRVYLGSRPEDLASTATAILVTNHGGAELGQFNGVPLITDDQADIRNIVTEIDPFTLDATERFEDLGADYAGLDVRQGLVVFAGAASGTVHVHPLGGPPDLLHSLDLLEGDTLPGGTVPSGLRVFSNTRDVVARLPDQVFAVNFLRDTMVELWLVGNELIIHGETPLNPVGVPIQAFQPAPAVNFDNVQNGERYLNTLSAWARGQTDFSCATCHSDGHSDLRMIFNDVVDPHDPPQIQGAERHPSLRFTSLTAPFAWEGDQRTLFEFNAEALDTHDVPPADGEIFLDVAEFMAFFFETLTDIPNPNPANNPNGKSLFEGAAGCASCHPAPDFTDNAFHDVGTERVINTPSLLGIWDQAHLLHDGRAATLEEVLDPQLYTAGGIPHGNLLTLSGQDRADLAAYVRGLRGPGQSCGADIDCDGVVGILDFLFVLGNWGPCPDPPATCPADLDGDGVVGINDFLIVLGSWG